MFKNFLAILAMLLLSSSGFSAVRTFSADSSIVTSDGVKLFLKAGGKGSPCIFVHGGPGAWSKSFEVLGGNALESTLKMTTTTSGDRAGRQAPQAAITAWAGWWTISKTSAGPRGPTRCT